MGYSRVILPIQYQSSGFEWYKIYITFKLEEFPEKYREQKRLSETIGVAIMAMAATNQITQPVYVARILST